MHCALSDLPLLQLLINSRIDNDECPPKINENKQKTVRKFPKSRENYNNKTLARNNVSVFLAEEGETVNRVNDDITPKKHPL